MHRILLDNPQVIEQRLSAPVQSRAFDFVILEAKDAIIRFLETVDRERVEGETFIEYDGLEGGGRARRHEKKKSWVVSRER